MSKIITAFERAIWTNIARSTSVNHERVQKERQVFFEAAVKVVKAGAIVKAKTKMEIFYGELRIYSWPKRPNSVKRESRERKRESKAKDSKDA